MKYLAFAMKIEIMFIGLLMMYFNQVVSSPPFMSWLAILTIGIYLMLQGCYGSDFSGSLFKTEKKVVKKKGFFRR